MNKYCAPFVCMLAALLLMAGCAPSSVDHSALPDADGDAAGFWQGLWHGFILLFTFIASLFSDSVGIYELQNSGNLYNLGFLLGVMIFFGGSSRGTCKRTR